MKINKYIIRTEAFAFSSVLSRHVAKVTVTIVSSHCVDTLPIGAQCPLFIILTLIEVCIM